MSKNMTRKGLAFGAGFAMIASAFVSVPAQAAGIEELVTLVPGAGPEDAYTVFSGDGNTFTLTADKPGTLSGNTHFLVEDATSSFEVTIATTGLGGVDLDTDGDDDFARDADGVVTITVPDNTAPFDEGDRIYLKEPIATDGAEADVAAGYYTVASATDANGASTFTFQTSIEDDAIATEEMNANGEDFYYLHSGRAADGSFVVDTGDTSGEASITLEVQGDTARSVTVTAWDDSTANSVLGTEYKSPARTVNFMDFDDITWTTSLVAPNVGDESLVAEVTTDPMVNADYLADGGTALTGFISVLFTRQDSSEGLVALPVGKAAQSDLTGTFEVSINLEAETNVGFSLEDNGTLGTGGNDNAADTAWADIEQPAAKDADQGIDVANSSITDEVLTVKTDAAHKLRVGDVVDIDGVTGDDAALINDTDGYTVTSIPSTTTFTVSIADAADDTALSEANAGDALYLVETYDDVDQNALVDRVFAGDYSAQAVVSVDATAATDIPAGDDSATYELVGLKSALGVVPAVADDIVFNTTASASVQGVSVKTDNNTDTDSKVKAGTLTATVVATVVDEDGDAVGAGRNVTYTLTRSHSTLKVNGLTVGSSAVTDANGKITFTVTDTLGEAGRKLTISAVAEGVATADSAFTFEWVTPALTVVDLNNTSAEVATAETRYIAKSSSYVLGLLVADQWYTAASSADYRLKVTGQGVAAGFVSLVDGKANVTVTDAGVSSSYDTVVTLQKKSATTGLFADTTTVKTITNKVDTKPAVKLAADGSALYDGSTADLADLVAEEALVELDTRKAAGTKPEYENFVTVTGKIVNGTSNVSLGGSVVTISGPSNILFEQGTLNVAKRGSLTFLADATDGEFTVNLYSTTAQKDTVITVTSQGVSATVKVTFTGIGVGEGTALTVTAPDAVKPASTFQVKAKLADTYGNGVDTAAGRVKVTYTGPGIVFGTLPTETDANGELMFSVLLGSNDTGNVVVTVSYDQNGDGDFVDAKDLNTTKTVVISASGSVATGKVNVGSFNGKLVVYAAGLNGAKISWKVGGKWGTGTATSNYAIFNRPTPRAGATVSVDIYVNGVKTLTKSVVTR